MQGWKFNKINTKKVYSFPPGNYYIGDICYVLDDVIYDTVFGGSAYESGLYSSTNGQFLVSNTYAGDGTYTGSDGFDYMVDAGIIGIVSSALISKDTIGGKIYDFPKGVHVTMKDGIFIFQADMFDLEINTKE